MILLNFLAWLLPPGHKMAVLYTGIQSQKKEDCFCLIISKPKLSLKTLKRHPHISYWPEVCPSSLDAREAGEKTVALLGWIMEGIRDNCCVSQPTWSMRCLVCRNVGKTYWSEEEGRAEKNSHWMSTTGQSESLIAQYSFSFHLHNGPLRVVLIFSFGRENWGSEHFKNTLSLHRVQNEEDRNKT